LIYYWIKGAAWRRSFGNPSIKADCKIAFVITLLIISGVINNKSGGPTVIRSYGKPLRITWLTMSAVTEYSLGWPATINKSCSLLEL